MRLPDRLALSLREGLYTEKKADSPTPPSDESKWADWFDSTKIDQNHPLRPVKVWDPTTPMPQDTRYDNWWEQPAKWLQRGPGTTSYDTSRYTPNGVGDYIISFGGAGSGVNGSSSPLGYGRHYGGEGNVASFTWKQIPEAEKFILSLPKGSRLLVNGHSMGASAALALARRLAKRGIQIAGMDLRDPVRINGRVNAHLHRILENMHLRKKSKIQFPKNVTFGTNIYNKGWFPSLLWKNHNISDLVSFVGSRTYDMANNGNLVNIPSQPGKDHIDIGWLNNTDNFPVDQKWLDEQKNSRGVGTLVNPEEKALPAKNLTSGIFSNKN